jgi:hypothetical protein
MKTKKKKKNYRVKRSEKQVRSLQEESFYLANWGLGEKLFQTCEGVKAVLAATLQNILLLSHSLYFIHSISNNFFIFAFL